MKNKQHQVSWQNLSSILVLFFFLLSACTAQATPAPTLSVDAVYTQAAATIVAGITQTSQSLPAVLPAQPTTSPIPQPTETPIPAMPTVASAATETPAIPIVQVTKIATPITVDPAAAHGCYNASFISDVTIQYAPSYKPGDTFTKTWRVKNTGSCDWPRGFQLMYVSGDKMGGSTKTIDQKVVTGGTVDISINLTAPNLTGIITGNWQLTTDIGKSFGPILSVSITLPDVVKSTASSLCLNAELVSDVTIPTGTELDPNETFTKTWLVKNTGTCTWDNSFRITFVGGDMLGADTTKIRQVVGPGATAEISLSMKAPGSNSTVSSAWQMASDGGQLFGQLFAFSITVK